MYTPWRPYQQFELLGFGAGEMGGGGGGEEEEPEKVGGNENMVF